MAAILTSPRASTCLKATLPRRCCRTPSLSESLGVEVVNVNDVNDLSLKSSVTTALSA